MPGGVSAISTLALLNCGVPIDDPVMQKALNYVRQMNAKQTYAVSLQTMVLCAAEPKRDMYQIKQNVGWLMKDPDPRRSIQGRMGLPRWFAHRG